MIFEKKLTNLLFSKILNNHFDCFNWRSLLLEKAIAVLLNETFFVIKFMLFDCLQERGKAISIFH